MLIPFQTRLSDGSTSDYERSIVLRDLGRSDKDLGHLSVFVREMFQNTWDAKLEGQKPSFLIHKRNLNANQLRSFFDVNALEEPHRTAFANAFATLADNDLACFLVSDRNTKGISPVTELVEGAELNRWERFINIGASEYGAAPGGGTFGLGKLTSFRASEWRTIVVYTRYLKDNQVHSRLAAFTIMGATTLGQLNPNSHLSPGMTGKISWKCQEQEWLEGAEADRLAERLEIGGFAGTGTDILILGVKPLYDHLDEDPTTPDIDEPETERDRKMEKVLRDAFCWTYWRRLCDEGFGQCQLDQLGFKCGQGGGWDLNRIRNEYLQAGHGGNKILAAYIDLYEHRHERESVPIEHFNASEPNFGTLYFQRVPLDNQAIESSLSNCVFVPDNFQRIDCLRHIALMRKPEHVVNYEDSWIQRNRIGEREGVIGIFIAANEYNKEFALAEGPAHDSWSRENHLRNLPGAQRGTNNPISRFNGSMKRTCERNFQPPPSISGEELLYISGAVELGRFLGNAGGGLGPTPPPRCIEHNRPLPCPLCPPPAPPSDTPIRDKQFGTFWNEDGTRRIECRFEVNPNFNLILTPIVKQLDESGKAVKEELDLARDLTVEWRVNDRCVSTATDYRHDSNPERTAYLLLITPSQGRSVHSAVLAVDIGVEITSQED